MKKIYHLNTCSTNRRIIKSLPNIEGFEFQEIKKQPITEEQLQEMYDLAGSYQALFSKKAVLYKTLGLKNQNLTEVDYKKYILEHYSFLNRPVIIIDQEIFVGNHPNTIEALTERLVSLSQKPLGNSH
jgi:arsenate reductase